MAKPGQNIFNFKLLSARHKDETVTSPRLWTKHNNAFTDIRLFTCNLRSSNTEKFFTCHEGQGLSKKFSAYVSLQKDEQFYWAIHCTVGSDRKKCIWLFKLNSRWNYISCTRLRLPWVFRIPDRSKICQWALYCNFFDVPVLSCLFPLAVSRSLLRRSSLIRRLFSLALSLSFSSCSSVKFCLLSLFLLCSLSCCSSVKMRLLSLSLSCSLSRCLSVKLCLLSLSLSCSLSRCSSQKRPQTHRLPQILHWYACGADGWAAGRRVVYGHMITKFSGVGRFTYPWCSAGALRTPGLRYNRIPNQTVQVFGHLSDLPSSHRSSTEIIHYIIFIWINIFRVLQEQNPPTSRMGFK